MRLIQIITISLLLVVCIVIYLLCVLGKQFIAICQKLSNQESLILSNIEILFSSEAVSYTHLDVYKRQL